MPLRTNAAALRAYYLVSIAAMGVFLPFVPAWLAAQGVGGLWIGIISATRPLAGILVPAVVGVVADVFRLRGWLLRIACLGSVLATAVLVVVVGWSRPGPVVLTALFALLALFRAPMNTVADVMALELDVPYGRLRLWGSIGFLVSALVAGAVVDPRLPLPVPVSMLALLAGALVLAFVLPPRANVPPAPVWQVARGLLGSADFQRFLLAIFLWSAGHCAYDLTLTLHLGALGASHAFAGWAWALGTLAEVVLMAYCAPWIERHGPSRLMLLGMLTAATRWVLMACVHSPALLLALQPLHAGSFALVFIAAAAYLKRRAEPQVLATAQASVSVATSLGATLGLLAWGPLFEATGGATVFLAAAVVSLASVGAIGALPTEQPRATAP